MIMSRLAPFRLPLLALLTVLAGSLLTWKLLGSPSTGIDDADIFFVYARHLSDGHGFVYNIGGERVEGFTSLLWTLICACLFRVSDHIEVPLYAINLLIGVATLWVCLRKVQKPVVFLLLLAAVPAWFAWCQVTLMETGLWCRLLTLAILAVVDRRNLLLALLLPLLVVTRPESMAWGIWLLLMLFVRTGGLGGWRSGLKYMMLPAACFAAALLALVAFRMDYFGYPVPNTYYAKVSPNMFRNLLLGTGYLLQYLALNPVVVLAAIVWVGVAWRGLRRWRSGLDEPAMLALCLLPGIGIPVLVGGDHFGGFRFYQPIWPLLCLLVANEWPAVQERLSPKRTRVVLVALVLLGWTLFPFTTWLKHEFRIAQQGRETGAALDAMFGDLDQPPTVATITAGGSKVAYPGTVYDLMGLNNTEMAHAPGPRTGYKNHTAFNRDVFYGWHPDILLCGEDPDFDAKVLKSLPSEERFKQLYCKITMHRHDREVRAYYSYAFIERVH